MPYRKPVEYNAVISERIDLADGLAIFRVVPDSKDNTTFVPGQYAVLGMNHAEKGSVLRQYSIASEPQTLPDYLDFYVRYVKEPASDNPLTHLLFAAHAGDRLHMAPKIKGKFTVADELGSPDDPRLRVLVAAGTGLAPFTSMVFDHWRRLGPTKQYLVLHGASYPHDLGYRERMAELMNTDPTAPRYFPTISRAKDDATWKHDRGRVESFFESARLTALEAKAGLVDGFIRPENAVVFICGLTGTIANTLIGLLDRGFVPRDAKLRKAFGIPEDVPPSLFFEQYDSEPVIDLANATLLADCRERLSRAGVPAA